MDMLDIKEETELILQKYFDSRNTKFPRPNKQQMIEEIAKKLLDFYLPIIFVSGIEEKN